MGLVGTTIASEPGTSGVLTGYCIDWDDQPEKDVQKLGARSPAVIAIAGRPSL